LSLHRDARWLTTTHEAVPHQISPSPSHTFSPYFEASLPRPNYAYQA
jgi:hypothetical protein